MKDYWLRINEAWYGCVTTPLTWMRVTNLPAVLSLLGSPPCQGGPTHSKTAAAAQGAQGDTSTCLVSNLTTKQKQTLTGGPSLPGRPSAPFFPWGPCWMKVRKLALNFSNTGAKSQEQAFHLLSRHPNQPLWTRKTLQERRNDCFLFVFLSFLKCIKHAFEIFLGDYLCSYQDTGVALLSRCSNFARGTLFQTGNDVMTRI